MTKTVSVTFVVRFTYVSNVLLDISLHAHCTFLYLLIMTQKFNSNIVKDLLSIKMYALKKLKINYS